MSTVRTRVLEKEYKKPHTILIKKSITRTASFPISTQGQKLMLKKQASLYD
jgi:hypothetical protein